MKKVTALNGRQFRPNPIEITTTAVLDLTKIDEPRRRHAVWNLGNLDAGSHVRLIVDGDWADLLLVDITARAALDRGLHLHLEGADPHLVNEWARSLSSVITSLRVGA